MVTIGVDPHKDTHTAVIVNEGGKQLTTLTSRAVVDGFCGLLGWAREHHERVWVLEDCRHVSGPLERFLLDRGEQVVRLAPHLMAVSRTNVRDRGKSDPIDALAVARAALSEGIENLPIARLSGTELEIRLLQQHRQRLVNTRTRFINDLRWHLHDLWPELKIPSRGLKHQDLQARLQRRLARADQSTRVRIARDELSRVRDLTREINRLEREITDLVADTAPQLLNETGIGPITAAQLIGEIAGPDRFCTDAKLARAAGSAPRSRSHPAEPTGTASTAAETDSSTTPFTPSL